MTSVYNLKQILFKKNLFQTSSFPSPPALITKPFLLQIFPPSSFVGFQRLFTLQDAICVEFDRGSKRDESETA